MQRLGFAVLMTAVFILASGIVSGAGNADADRYVNAVRHFADNVLEHGRDIYGPKQTPLFVDGLNVDTLEPVRWKKDGDEWVLSNLASQQNLFRTLDGLTGLTGERRYRGAAVRTIRYAFDNLQGPNGLLYWGGHYAYDAGQDKLVWEQQSHELKRVYPYHELMWTVNPEATERYLNAFWRTHVIDWSNLDMNRHGKYDKDTNTPWPEKYEGGPVFFTSKANGLSFINTGSDIYYAGAMLHKLSGEKMPLVWAKRMAGRFAETANPKTGMRGFQYSRVTQDRAEVQFGDVERLKGHLVLEGTILPPTYGRMVHATAGIVQMELSDMLGDEGSEFRTWALDGLRAYGKHAYNPADNTFKAMLTDGTVLSRADIQKDGYYGKVGESVMLDSLKADPDFFWAYAMAFRISGDRFMWDMARNVGRGQGLGDIGDTSKGAPKLDIGTTCSDPMDLMGCLELHRCTGRSEFLDMAKRIGDNILEQRFYKGFFVPDKDHIYTKFDSLEPLVLLTLAAEIRGERSAVPEVRPSRSLFHCPFDGVGRTYDRDVIYSQLRPTAPPK